MKKKFHSVIIYILISVHWHAAQLIFTSCIQPCNKHTDQEIQCLPTPQKFPSCPFPISIHTLRLITVTTFNPMDQYCLFLYFI